MISFTIYRVCVLSDFMSASNVLLVAKLYSKSLFACCSTNDDIDNIKAHVDGFLSAYSDSVYLKGFLDKNSIPNSVKLDFLLSLGFVDILNNLFRLLSENDRLGFIFDIFTQFLEIVKIHNGEIDVVVVSAFALTKKDITFVNSVLRSYYKEHKISILNRVNATIIGGIIIKIGYLVLDFSTARKIDDLSRLSEEALKVF